MRYSSQEFTRAFKVFFIVFQPIRRRTPSITIPYEDQSILHIKNKSTYAPGRVTTVYTDIGLSTRL